MLERYLRYPMMDIVPHLTLRLSWTDEAAGYAWIGEIPYSTLRYDLDPTKSVRFATVLDVRFNNPISDVDGIVILPISNGIFPNAGGARANVREALNVIIIVPPTVPATINREIDIFGFYQTPEATSLGIGTPKASNTSPFTVTDRLGGSVPSRWTLLPIDVTSSLIIPPTTLHFPAYGVNYRVSYDFNNNGEFNDAASFRAVLQSSWPELNVNEETNGRTASKASWDVFLTNATLANHTPDMYGGYTVPVTGIIRGSGWSGPNYLLSGTWSSPLETLE